MLADPVIADDEGRVWAVCRFENKRRLVHVEVDEAVAMVLAAKTPLPPTPTVTASTVTASSTEFTPPKKASNAGPAAQSTMRSAKTTATSTSSDFKRSVKASSSHMTSPKRIGRWVELQKKSIDELKAEREKLEEKHPCKKNKQMLRDVIEALCQKKEEVAE